MERLFRFLRADEIDCRIGVIKENGLSLLLYKDARCDMNILDETFGAFNWQRHHERDNANCIVSIYDERKNEWIEKEDTGTESFTEAEKGLASDSFKRACFNWGIGRELYTAPFIWVTAENCNLKRLEKSGKLVCNDKFRVAEIDYNVFGEISHLVITNDTKGVDVFTTKQAVTPVLPVQAATTAETEKYFCADCEKEITDPKNRDGQPMPIKDYVAMCMKFYERPICNECRRKRGKAS